MAGFLVGTLMALVFAAHLSVMWALKPPNFVRNASPDGPNVLLLAMAAHVGGILLWPLIGVTAAVAFTVAEDRSALEAPGLPSGLYTGGVFLIAVLMAPPLLLLGRGRARHVIAELLLFVTLFGVAIPLLVQGARG